MAPHEQRHEGWKMSGGLQAVWGADDPRPRQKMTNGPAPPKDGQGNSHLVEQDLPTGNWTLQTTGTAMASLTKLELTLPCPDFISYSSATLTLKAQPGLPPACSWACYFAPNIQQSTSPYSRNAGCGPLSWWWKGLFLCWDISRPLGASSQAHTIMFLLFP